MNSYSQKHLVIIAITLARALAHISEIHITSHLQKEAKDNIDKDINLLESSIESLVRPELEGLPIVVQQLDGSKRTSTYYFPGEISKSQAVATSNTNDQGKKNVIFPMGDNGFGHRIENAYVVLRKNNGGNDTYFLNIAYLRKSGQQIVVEWSTVEKDQFGKSALEIELCRKDECEFPEWIIGTCQIVEHSCILGGTVRGNSVKHHAPVIKPPLLPEPEFERSTVPIPFIQKRNARNLRDVPPGQETKSIEGNEALRVPSSLDLLMRPKKNKDADDDSSFRNSIIKTREVNNDHLEDEALKCTQCQTLFDFFWDLEEQSLGFSQLVGKTIENEEYSNQASSILVENILQLHPNVPFVGFGNCNYSLEDLDRPKSKEIDDIAEFYLGTLMKDCDHVAQSDFRGWLTSKLKFLRIESDLTLDFLSTSQLLKSEIFSPEEFEMVMSVLLFSEYTNIYHEERALLTSKDKDVPTWTHNPVGLKISKIIGFLTRLFLRLISSVRQSLNNHLVKSLRAIIRYLKDKFLSLLVEKRKLAISYTDKNNRAVQMNIHKEINCNDLNQIMALKEFTLYGLGPVFKSGTLPVIAFESFYKLNKKRVDFLVNAYDKTIVR